MQIRRGSALRLPKARARERRVPSRRITDSGTVEHFRASSVEYAHGVSRRISLILKVFVR